MTDPSLISLFVRPLNQLGIPYMVTGGVASVVYGELRFTEMHPAVSRDGHWLAYTSNESGANEVYVRPFPETSRGRWQVSTGGGSEPIWSPDGRELFFLDGATRLVAADVRTVPAFEVDCNRCSTRPGSRSTRSINRTASRPTGAVFSLHGNGRPAAGRRRHARCWPRTGSPTCARG